MEIKHYDLYIHDIRHSLSENGKLLCKLRRLVPIISIFLYLSKASKEMAAEYKASFFKGYYYYLMEGCRQNYYDGYKPCMEVTQPTKNTLA